MWTARTRRPRTPRSRAEAAANKLAESAPPLNATASPVAPAGAWASRTARREAAEKLINWVALCVPERTEAAQARLPRVEQLRHRLIAELGQILDHALLD